MDLLSLIQTADPTKVRVAERQRVEDEPRLLEATVGRVVSLLPVAPARASSGMEAGVDKLFHEGVVAPLQPRRQRKRKTVLVDASDPSHPPKKLREDYGALGGAFVAGKSRSAVQSLFTGAVLNAEARGEPIPTLPFVTSYVSAIPEREDKSANIAEAEVDSIVRSSALAIATVTTVTVTVDADTTADRVPVEPSLFGVGSSLTGRTDSVPDGFSDVSGSDFLTGGIRTVVEPNSDLQKVYVLQWSVTNGLGLDDSRICREILDEFAPPKFFASVRGMDHDQLFTERLRSVVDEKAELLKVRDGEIENLKAQLVLKEAEAAEAIPSVKVRKHEVADLDAQVTAVKLQNDNLVDQVQELEISSVGLQEKVDAYEDFISQLEKFQDEEMEDVNENMELAIVRCLNSTEYLSALGAAISKAVEKGMQEGLSVGITHGAEGRKLADVAAYNPYTETDYLLGLTESQPHANQLMLPIHHSPDQRVIGAFALSLSLDVSHSRVRKIRENITSNVSALRGIFVPLSEPLSAAALEGTEGTFGSAHDTTTALFVMVLRGRVCLLWSLSLYAPLPNASVTSYGPSHLDPSLSPSLAWLASLLWYTKSPGRKEDPFRKIFVDWSHPGDSIPFGFVIIKPDTKPSMHDDPILGRSGTLIRQGSACNRDLRMLIPFRGCLLVRG
nr:hypothetical protein [Tanacetum cinerariifolium]